MADEKHLERQVHIKRMRDADVNFFVRKVLNGRINQHTVTDMINAYFDTVSGSHEWIHVTHIYENGIDRLHDQLLTYYTKICDEQTTFKKSALHHVNQDNRKWNEYTIEQKQDQQKLSDQVETEEELILSIIQGDTVIDLFPMISCFARHIYGACVNGALADDCEGANTTLRKADTTFHRSLFHYAMNIAHQNGYTSSEKW